MNQREVAEEVVEEVHRPAPISWGAVFAGLVFTLAGYRGGDSLEEISWDDFFDKFEEKGSPFSTKTRPLAARKAAFPSW